VDNKKSSGRRLEWRRLEMRAISSIHFLGPAGDKLFPSSGGRHLSLFARAPPNIPSAFLAAVTDPSSSRAAAFHTHALYSHNTRLFYLCRAQVVAAFTVEIFHCIKYRVALRLVITGSAILGPASRIIGSLVRTLPQFPVIRHPVSLVSDDELPLSATVPPR
jgi:hypothetical protein